MSSRDRRMEVASDLFHRNGCSATGAGHVVQARGAPKRLLPALRGEGPADRRGAEVRRLAAFLAVLGGGPLRGQVSGRAFAAIRRSTVPGPLALLLLALPFAGAAQDSRGSAVPCAVPMGWHVAELDPRFGLDPEEARDAVEAAAALWEAAVDRPLFRPEPEGVLPVSFHYDQRQADFQVRREAELALRRLGEALDSARLGIEARQADLARDRKAHEERIQRLLARMDAYNREVERWNLGGGAPDTIRSRLAERATELSREQEALQAEDRALARRDASLSEEVQELNRRVEARNRRAGELTRAYSGRVTEAGRYDEQVETTEREVRVRRRGIRIFRFEGRDDLVLVLAHELGHALGLGHVAAPDAVMSTVMEGTPAQGLHPADLHLLDSTCPGLR